MTSKGNNKTEQLTLYSYKRKIIVKGKEWRVFTYSGTPL